jgi:hypothetical protein
MPETDEEEFLPPAGSPMLSLAGTPASATAAKTPLSAQRGSSSTPAAAVVEEDAEMGEFVMPQEAFEDVILQTVEAQADKLQQQVQAIPTESGSTEHEVSAGEMGEGCEQQEEESGDCMIGSEGGEGDFSMDAGAAADSAAMDLTFGSPAGAGNSPAAGFFAAGVTATPYNTPAAAAVTSPGVTSPGARYRSSSAMTAAPPKSALAKPKSAGSSVVPKHAHVVVPEAASPEATPSANSNAGGAL